MFKEGINIPFTTKGKQRPLSDIIREFSAHLECEGSSGVVNCTHRHTPESLVGRRVLYRFEIDKEDQERWFPGFIVSYNPQACLHEITYDEEEHCFF